MIQSLKSAKHVQIYTNSDVKTSKMPKKIYN